MSSLDNLDQPVSDSNLDHPSSNPMDVEIIQWAFNDVSQYKTTDKKALPLESAISCQYCGMITNDKYSLSMHVKRNHEIDLPFRCSHCPKAFVIHSELKKHLLTHSDLKSYACGICSKAFRSRTGRNQHRATHATLNFRCDFCNKSFMRAQDLKLHIKLVHTANSRGYKCAFCRKIFVNLECLSAHQDSHVKKLKIGQKSSSHRKKSSKSKKNTCNSENYEKIDKGECFICHMKFTFRKDALAHLLAQHPNEARENFSFKCSECSYVGRSKTALAQHSCVHASKKIFKCPLCNYAGVRKLDVKRHYPIHLNEKNYACNTCGKKFISKFRLTLHKKTHREKTIACDICGKKFTCKSYMINHRKEVHHGSQKLCEICGKSYSCRQTLVKHMKNHHSEEPNFKTAKKHITNKDLPANKAKELLKPKNSNAKVHENLCKEEILLSYECFACGELFVSGTELHSHCSECCNIMGIANINPKKEIQCSPVMPHKIFIENANLPMDLGSSRVAFINYGENQSISEENYDENYIRFHKSKESKSEIFTKEDRLVNISKSVRAKNHDDSLTDKIDLAPSNSSKTEFQSTKSKLVSICGKEYLPINKIESSDLTFLHELLANKDKSKL